MVLTWQFKNNEFERADRLMNILERRPNCYLTQFYYALEANDQRDLVQLIKYKGITHDYTRCPQNIAV